MNDWQLFNHKYDEKCKIIDTRPDTSREAYKLAYRLLRLNEGHYTYVDRSRTFGRVHVQFDNAETSYRDRRKQDNIGGKFRLRQACKTFAAVFNRNPGK